MLYNMMILKERAVQLIFLWLGIFSVKSVDGSVHLVCENPPCDTTYSPIGPLVKCDFLPLEFLECEEPLDLKGNKTAQEEKGYGCLKFGGQKYEDVEKTEVYCTVLENIECFGERRFLRGGFPCIRYGTHYFLSTLLYSILLGFLGLDRFCLGHTGTAVGKVLTLGGVGIWWMVDIILVITGGLQPEDGTNWVPYA